MLKQYTLTDFAPALPVSYYRVKLVTVTEELYSKTLQADRGLITEATVYPNPADKQITIKWIGTPGATYVITLTSMDGKKVLLQKTKENFMVFPINEWPAGTYLLQVQEPNRSILSRQLVVRH